jgi:hypothetical protein
MNACQIILVLRSSVELRHFYVLIDVMYSLYKVVETRLNLNQLHQQIFFLTRTHFACHFQNTLLLAAQ